jgi:hypothetical protein
MTKPPASAVVSPAPRVAWTTARLALVIAGLALTAAGAVKLTRLGSGDVVAGLWWLFGGVVAHDALLAPLTIVVLYVTARVLPSWLRAPAAVGFVVIGTVTVSAIPVLTRFGARPDNPTLLDRNYVAGWLVFAAAVALAVGVASWKRRSADRALTADRTAGSAPTAGRRSPP